MPDDKDFDKLWKVMTEQQYDNQLKSHYKIKGNTNGGRKNHPDKDDENFDY